MLSTTSLCSRPSVVPPGAVQGGGKSGNILCLIVALYSWDEYLRNNSKDPGLLCLPIYCCFSVDRSCLTFCSSMDCTHKAFPSFTISQSLLKFMSIELVMLSNHLILCSPLLLLPSVFPTIRVFSNESAFCILSSESALRIRWPKCWNFHFSNSPFNCC